MYSGLNIEKSDLCFIFTMTRENHKMVKVDGKLIVNFLIKIHEHISCMSYLKHIKPKIFNRNM